jgi:hypothetical protein
MKFTIDRKVWLCGEGGMNSRLLRSADGKMCCVGIFLKACGVTDEAMVDVGCAMGVRAELPAEHQWLTEIDEESDIMRLYLFNDAHFVAEPREQDIAAIFTKHGVAVEFVG